MKTTAVLAVGVALASFLAAGCSDDDQPGPSSGSEQANWDGEPSVDPYTSSGVWAVPDQIEPGRYAVTAGTGH